MVATEISWMFIAVAVALPFPVTAADPVEPNAGNWRTWVISSGRDYRVPPPPGAADTQAELHALADLIAGNDAEARQQIAFWDAGAPAYRWIDLITARLALLTPTTTYPHRVYTYVAIAMYDATIATWESKYAYNRQRPSERDHKLPTAVTVPESPSYPSEHAATAQAAAAVLAYFLPAEAQSFQTMAEQAGWSRVLAGVQYPSDYYAGLELGRKVAEKVIALAKQDGADAVWSGAIPPGPCRWSGTLPPANGTAANWKPLLLTSAAMFRPPPPPSCDSPQVLQELETVRNTPRAVPGNAAIFTTNYKAFYWQSPEGINTWPYRYVDKWIAEDRLDRNPPRAARIYALIAAVYYDAFIASHDAKFTYWYIRPPQLAAQVPGLPITPLFPVPNHPSYPANHATFSTARSEMLAYLFPTRADFVRGLAKEAGESRISAGIHYPTDLAAGTALGRSVAQLFIARAQSDGSQ